MSRTAILSLAGLALATFALEPAAASAQTVPILSKSVSYGDLDLSSRRDSGVLLRRIQRTAHDICVSANFGQDGAIGDYAAQSRMPDCIARATDRAVAQIHSPALSSAYAAEHGSPQRIETASAR